MTVKYKEKKIARRAQKGYNEKRLVTVKGTNS